MAKINMPGVSRASKKLGQLFAKENFLQIPSTGWTSTVVAGGTASQGITAQRINTSVTASSSSLLTVLLWNSFTILGVAGGGGAQTMDWSKKLTLICNVSRNNSDAEGVARIQIKAASTIGALGDKGIGLRIDNLALVGESYGTSLDTVDLATTLSAGDTIKLKIVLDPVAAAVYWFVDDVLKGTQSTSGKYPGGTSGTIYAALSVANGATGGVNYFLDVSNMIIIQDT